MDEVLRLYMNLEEKVLGYNPHLNTKRLREAYEYARENHGEQRRKDGSPFVTHPLSAADIAADMGLDEDALIATLLHDLVEDTKVSFDDVKKLFGIDIAELVDGVTKLSRVTYTSKEEEQVENLRKMLMATAKDIRVILIKIADRLHNLRTMEYQSQEKQREKALESLEIYAPIAHRLGIQRIKWELEDLSLIYLDPIGYTEITSQLDLRRSSLEKFMETIKERIEARMNEYSIESTVNGRLKHVYSIYRKMYSQNKDLSEVLDLCAFRVIVGTIPDCYNVLGHLHDLFKPIPGKFKDYISTPKPNMYQSIHTTVIGSEGIPFEVQIRTWDMHHTAEYGVAAHWKYKQGMTSGKQSDEEKYAWIRSLLEASQDTDASDFVSELKTDMFADEVFVFTPKGDVFVLPVNATPIDFAYKIHSAIGNRMIGAKIGGKIVPFDHTLQTGDVIEILTSNASKGPSRDWIAVAKSSEAKGKIKQWFKKEKREENIIHGKASFESEMKRNHLNTPELINDELFAHVLKKLSFGSADEMYAAIGFGGISATRVVNRLRDELLRRMKREDPAEKLKDDKLSASFDKHTKSIRGIIVEGIDNCLVKFSRCCTPVPGDKIIGFITRGYGVSVHRIQCKNYLNAQVNTENEGRWINVSWSTAGDETYQTNLTITATDRDGLILDIATAMSTSKTRIVSLNVRKLDAGKAVASVTIEVKDKGELMSAVSRLMVVSGISAVSRAGG